MPKYNIEVELCGNDGNAYAIMGAVRKALRKAGAGKDELDQYFAQATAGDYDHLLRTTIEWVKVS